MRCICFFPNFDAGRIGRVVPAFVACALLAVLARPSQAQATFTWSSGLLPATTIGPTQSMLINTSANHDHDGVTITNQGTIDWAAGAGPIRSGNNGGIVNAAGAFFNDSASSSLANAFSGVATFTNNGTYRKLAAGTTTVSMVFANNASVLVTEGDLRLTGGGSAGAAATFAVSSGQQLTLSGGTYDLAGGAAFSGAGTTALAGATLAIASGTASFARLTLSSGTLGGAGAATIAELIQTGGSIPLAAFTLTGASSWGGGDWHGPAGSTATIQSGAALTLTNGAYHDFNRRTIANHGTTTWLSGYIRGANGSMLVNYGTFEDKQTSGYNVHTATFEGTSGTFGFTNHGTFVRNGANTSYYDIPFDNNGTVTVTLGDLQLRGGGAMPGTATMTAASGTNVYFTSGYATGSGAALTGAGTFRLTNGTFTATGTLNLGTFVQTGGTFAGTHTLAGTFDWQGGNWNAATAGFTTTLANSSTLNLGNGSYHDFNRRGILNQGTVNWSSGYIRGGNGSTFTNASGATFNDLQTAGYSIHNPSFEGTAGTFTITNGGTWVRNGSNTTYFDVPFDNHGTFTVSAGAVQFRAGGTLSSSGTIAAAAGTNVYFTSDYTIANGASMSGAGAYHLTGGDLTVNGTVNVGAFTQTGGTLRGTNVLNGTITWNGGNWNAATAGFTTTLAAAATLNLGNGAYHDFNRRGIVNEGTVNWSSGYIRGGNGSTFAIASGATFNDTQTAGYSIHNPSFEGTAGTFTITNHGTYKRNGGNTTYIDVPFANHGRVEVVAGDLQFRGGGSLAAAGRIEVAAGATVAFTQGFGITDGASLTGAGSFTLSGGTLAIDSGTLSAGALNVSGGTLDLSGVLNAAAFTQTGGSVTGSHTLNGAIHWNGGDWNGAAGATTTLGAASTLNLGGGAYHDFNRRAITALGTVNWDSGYIRGGNGSTFTIATGATFNDRQTAGYTIHNPSFGGSAGTFKLTNHGAYVRNGSNITYFDVPFDNHSTITLQAGDLHFRAGGAMSSAGTVTAAAGTNVVFASNYTIADGASLGGAGAYHLTSGDLSIDGTVNVGTLTQTGGTLLGTNVLTGVIHWNGGSWSAPAAGFTTTLASSGTLNLGNGSYHDFNRRGIVNQGTVNWSSGYIRGGNGSTFTIASGATFNDLQTAGYSIHNPSFEGTAGTFTFTNDGTYIRDGANVTYLDVPFVNNRVLDLRRGDIHFRGGGSLASSGSISAAAGTNVVFNSDYAIANGVSLSGAGTYRLTGGTLTLTGQINVGTFQQTGGTLAGTATIQGTFNWFGGDWNAPATGTTITIASGGTLNVGDAYHDFNRRGLVSNGVVNWTSGYIRGSNGAAFTVNAGATFNDLQSAGYSIHNPSLGGTAGTFTFTNHGLYHRAATGTTFIDVPFTNTGTILVAGGTLNFRSTFTNDNGSVIVANGATAQFAGTFATGAGALSGTGTLSAPSVTAGGLVTPGNSAGTLGITGNLTLLSASTLLIELGGTTQGAGYDFLSVGGTAALGGVLAVKFVNGFQAAALPTDTFTVLKAGGAAALSGAFSNVASGQRIFTSDGFGSFQVNYGVTSGFATNSVVLSNFVAVPEPSTCALLVLGAAALGFTLRRRR